jgi:uridylate kinase
VATHEDQEELVMLKASGKMCSPDKGYDEASLNSFTGKIKYVMDRRTKGLAITTGGGNIFRAEFGLGLSQHDADVIGMIGLLANGNMLAGKLRAVGLKCTVIYTYDPVNDCPIIPDYELAVTLMEQGEIVIFAGGTGSGGVTTDTAAAMHAAGCGIKMIWMLKDRANGVFTSDPNTDPTAEHLPNPTASELLELQLGIMDDKALILAIDNDITHLVVAGDTKNQWHVHVTGGEQVEHSIIIPV